MVSSNPIFPLYSNFFFVVSANEFFPGACKLIFVMSANVYYFPVTGCTKSGYFIQCIRFVRCPVTIKNAPILSAG